MDDDNMGCLAVVFAFIYLLANPGIFVIFLVFAVIIGAVLFSVLTDPTVLSVICAGIPLTIGGLIAYSISKKGKNDAALLVVGITLVVVYLVFQCALANMYYVVHTVPP